MSDLSRPDAVPPGPSRWGRRLLPAILGNEDALPQLDGGSDLPRSLRDWAVDLTLFGLAGLVALGNLFSDHREVHTGLLIVDGLIGLIACVALWWRRRRPLPVGWFLAGIAPFSDCALGAALIGVFTVAVHCRPRQTRPLIAVAVLDGLAATWLLYPDSHHILHAFVLWLCGLVAALALGMYVRSRRELLLSLRERALRAEEQQHLRVRDAQLSERARIAREMHDVLAHRISLLSLHAGALEYNPNVSPEETAQAAAVIRQNARAAQEELREVIGVLRAGESSEELAPPQPGLRDLDRLIAETRDAGVDVLTDLTLDEEHLDTLTGRTLYRVLQEALTNVRKHAPAQVVQVRIAAGPHVVSLEVLNRPRAGRAETDGTASRDRTIGAHPRSGLGLVGLAERVSLIGGVLESGPLGDGGFRLAATLPLGEPDG